jgi:hypothetical protein
MISTLTTSNGSTSPDFTCARSPFIKKPVRPPYQLSTTIQSSAKFEMERRFSSNKDDLWVERDVIAIHHIPSKNARKKTMHGETFQ